MNDPKHSDLKSPRKSPKEVEKWSVGKKQLDV
jgi:hypothetical protein